MAQLNGWGIREVAVRSKPHTVTQNVPTPFKSPPTKPALRWLDGKAAPVLPKGVCPDAINLSPTTLLSPYSVLLHPSKDGSDTRLQCHRETQVSLTGSPRTGALSAWRQTQPKQAVLSLISSSTTTQSPSFLVKHNLCSNLSSRA